MAVEIFKCVNFMDNLLSANNFQDYCLNGLQVSGKTSISKVISAVSVSERLFTLAIEKKADLIIVHHGLFWHKQPMQLIGVQQSRVKQLLIADINLVAYHLPLDAHKKIGNNILLAESVGGRYVADLPASVGIIVELPQPVLIDDFITNIAGKLARTPDLFPGSRKSVKRLAICTGAAQHDFLSAINNNVDAFITGEVSEFVPELALESGVHYLACGHYATEVFGIKSLGALLAKEFSIEHEFIDLFNRV